MANKLNIAPVISPDILKTISAATAIKTFGDQLKNKNKETVISVSKNKTTELQAEVNAITKKEIELGEAHSNELKRLNTLFQQKQITEEEYQKSVLAEDNSYQIQLLLLREEKAKLEKDINNINNDPYKQVKDKQKLFKAQNKALRKKTNDSEVQSKRNLTKQVVSNAVKSLAPIVALQFTNQFSKVISQRKKLEELVNQINIYIDTQVKDQQTVTIATNLRNNAINLINNNIKKLESIKKTIDIFTIIITVMNAILQIINIPPTVIADKVAQRLRTIISALAAVLAIVSSLLANEIAKLKELAERLKQISLKLDGKTLDNLNSEQLSELTNAFLPTGIEYPPYKGFKFKIKEEQDPRFVVKGNKRRYAVAIDSDGVEVLKSEYSFTQDPNDLIEQLKLIIDQRNLQG